MSAPTDHQRLLPEKNADEEHLPKERLLRKADRQVRALSSVTLRDTLSWMVRVTWPVFVTQSVFAGINVYLNVKYDWSFHTNFLELPANYRPFLIAPLQFMSAFLTGLALNDAVGRFKTALAALIGFRTALEGLRTQLLASTEDPKLETAVQVFLAMAVVLLLKQICFWGEDFSKPILGPLRPAYKMSVCFSPEVLWTFTSSHWKFLFNDFLTHSKMSDKYTDVLLKNMSDSWDKLEELIAVKAPYTKNQLTRVLLQLYFFSIPLFNEDTLTQTMVPVIACLYIALISLARELADPWHENQHAVPLQAFIDYLVIPVETQGCVDDPHAEDQAIQWMNKGLMTSEWATTLDPPFPRQKRTHPNMGQEVTFNGMRSIPQIANRKNWYSFTNFVNKDMDVAHSNGRRMPGYLREGSLMRQRERNSTWFEATSGLV